MMASSSIWHWNSILAKTEPLIIPFRILKRAIGTAVRSFITGVASVLFVFLWIVVIKWWPTGPEDEW
jgi:hypothetical protein